MKRPVAALTLSARIALAAAATISAAIASYGFVTHRQQERQLLDLSTRAAVSAASDAADGAVHHMLLGDFAAVDQLLVRLARNPEVERITVVEASGVGVAEVVREAGAGPPRYSAVPGRFQPPDRPTVTVETSPPAVVVWQPITAARVLGWVRLVHRLDALHAAQRATTFSAAALAVLWSLAATVLLVLLLRPPVVSIRRLAEFARRLGAHKGDAVEVPSASPEIAQLARALGDASRELREGEARLLSERRLLAATLGSIADGVVATDRDGRIVLANEAAEKLAARPAGWAVGRSFEELFPGGGEGPGGAGAVARVLAAGRPVHLGELRVAPGPDGGDRRASLGGAPIVGDPSGAVLVLRDVTAQQEAEREHRRLQEAFEQAQKLESVGRLAGGVAHDFNNVLTVILGNVEAALLGIGRDHPLATPLLEMREAAESAATLTRQLLAFSRKSVIEPQTLDLDEGLGRMAKMLGRLIGEDVVLRIEPGRAGLVRVDPGQLEQILINLAVNARDAMPSGGRLSIGTFTESIAAGDPRLAAGAAPGAYAVVSVADTGSGMTEAVKRHIFEPFFTTKERGKGTGLGLATVYGAVVQNHGFVQVESEPGRGTTFRIFLPRVDGGGDETRAAGDALEPVAAGSETILLVEDEAPVRRLASRILVRAGYRVIACADGGEAFAAAKRDPGPIHLILSDVVMPGMDGPTLVRALVPILPGARVLFVSGYSGDSSQALEHLARNGATVLQKPFTPAILSKAVRSVLDAAA